MPDVCVPPTRSRVVGTWRHPLLLARRNTAGRPSRTRIRWESHGRPPSTPQGPRGDLPSIEEGSQEARRQHRMHDRAVLSEAPPTSRPLGLSRPRRVSRVARPGSAGLPVARPRQTRLIDSSSSDAWRPAPLPDTPRSHTTEMFNNWTWFRIRVVGGVGAGWSRIRVLGRRGARSGLRGCKEGNGAQQ